MRRTGGGGGEGGGGGGGTGPPGDLGAAHLLDGQAASQSPQVGIGETRVLLLDLLQLSQLQSAAKKGGRRWKEASVGERGAGSRKVKEEKGWKYLLASDGEASVGTMASLRTKAHRGAIGTARLGGLIISARGVPGETDEDGAIGTVIVLGVAVDQGNDVLLHSLVVDLGTLLLGRSLLYHSINIT